MTRQIACKPRRLPLLIVAISLTTQCVLSQAPATPPAANTPTYDVVSIKPNNSGSGSSGIDSNDYSYTAGNVSLKTLLESAYNIRPDLIFGLTGPIASAHFDIQAKIVSPDLAALKKLSIEQRRSMLLAFLVERFHVQAHIEIKTLPVYEMVVLKSGAKFSRSTGNSEHFSMSIHSRELTGREIPMTSLANTLTGQLHRTVIDKTGLPGPYDLTLKWSPPDGSDTETDSDPPILTALQEQLGLKLQPAKGPVETLVVDHAEMPSEN